MRRLYTEGSFRVSFHGGLYRLSLVSLLGVCESTRSRTGFRRFLILGRIAGPSSCRLGTEVRRNRFSKLSTNGTSACRRGFGITVRRVRLLERRGGRLVRVLASLGRGCTPSSPPNGSFSRFGLRQFGFASGSTRLVGRGMKGSFAFSFANGSVSRNFILNLDAGVVNLFYSLNGVIVSPERVSSRLCPKTGQLLRVFFSSGRFLRRFNSRSLDRCNGLLEGYSGLEGRRERRRRRRGGTRRRGVRLVRTNITSTGGIAVVGNGGVRHDCNAGCGLRSKTDIITSRNVPSGGLRTILAVTSKLKRLSGGRVPFRLRVRTGSLSPGVRIAPVGPSGICVSDEPTGKNGQ